MFTRLLFDRKIYYWNRTGFIILNDEFNSHFFFFAFCFFTLLNGLSELRKWFSYDYLKNYMHSTGSEHTFHTISFLFFPFLSFLVVFFFFFLLLLFQKLICRIWLLDGTLNLEIQKHEKTNEKGIWFLFLYNFFLFEFQRWKNNVRLLCSSLPFVCMFWFSFLHFSLSLIFWW